MGIAIDCDNNIFITGHTQGGLYNATNDYNGSLDAFVARFSGNGKMLWTTYIGGNNKDLGYSIVVDCSDNIFITGGTEGGLPNSTNIFYGYSDAFVGRLTYDGEIVWTTYVGGVGPDTSYSVAVDCNNNIFITGETQGGLPNAINDYEDEAFVGRLNYNGEIIWTSYVGGNATIGSGIAVDCNNNIFITGFTFGGLPNATNSHSNAINNEFWDAFVGRLSYNGTITWTTYVGGDYNDYGRGISVDCRNYVFITGATRGGLPNNTNENGGEDAFVACLDYKGGIRWTTYIGDGDSGAWGEGITVDCNNNIFIAGSTNGELPKTTNHLSGRYDAFVTRLSATTGSIKYSIYIGGSDNDEGNGIALPYRCCCCCCCTNTTGTAPYVYLVGFTHSVDLPNKTNELNTQGDAFVAKIDTSLPANPPEQPIIPNPPRPPSEVSATVEDGCQAGCVGSVTLTWNTVRNADGYLIYNANANQLWKWVKDGTTTSYTFNNLPCGRTYHFYVKTHSSEYGNSQPSKTVAVVIPPCSSGGSSETPAVSLVWPQNNAALNYDDFGAADYLVVFAWNQVENAKAYLLWLKLDDGEHEPVEANAVLSAANGLIEAGDLAGIYFMLDKAGWNSLVPYMVTWQVSALSDPQDLNSIIGSSAKQSFTFNQAP